MIPREKLSLILCCASQVRRGVGKPFAFPVVKYGKKRYSAPALSRRLGEAFIPLGDAWVKRETLESLGLNPLGRLAGGAPLKPLKLKPLELMYRGGDALLGVWSAFEFKEKRWVVSASPGEIFETHLDFLRYYGIAGGVLTGGGEASPAALGAYLRRLSGEIEDGRVFIFMARDYYEKSFRRVWPPVRPSSVPPNLTGGRFEEGPSLFSPQFRGIGVCFYEDMPNNAGFPAPQCDILIFVEPEGSAPASDNSKEAGYFAELAKIKTRLRLGIFNHAPDNTPGSYGTKLREFCSLRGKMRALEKHLIRDENSSLRLPRRYGFTPRELRRPPCPFKADEEELVRQGIDRNAVIISGGARFVIRAKFKGLGTPEFKEEQRWFSFDGKEAPYTAYTVRRDPELDFNRLEKGQRDYFFWWRGEFRRGNPRKTCRGYILLYARELILSMGREEPRENFRKLLRLLRDYRDEEPDLDKSFLPWIMDFMVLYHIWEETIGEMAPRKGEPALFVIKNILLHKRYLEGDYPPAFADFEPILPPAAQDFRKSPQGPLLETALEIALREIDGFLRKTYGKRLLEFFYPPYTAPVNCRGFENLYGLGFSSYTVEFINFYDHKPLGDFIDTLACYIINKINERMGFEKKDKEPAMEAIWKDPVDRALGFEPGKIRDRPGTRSGSGLFRMDLKPERVARLRSESDEVRDMLRIDEGNPLEHKESETAPPFSGRLSPPPDPGKTVPGIAGFFAGLDQPQGEALRILAGGEDGGMKKAALKELAKSGMIMPEFLIDTINGQFQVFFQDLLIETVDGEPRISTEYEEDIRGYFAPGGSVL